MCDVTHNKSFALVLTAIKEVRNCIVYIIYEIIVFFCQYFYDVVYDVKLPYPG